MLKYIPRHDKNKKTMQNKNDKFKSNKYIPSHS